MKNGLTVLIPCKDEIENIRGCINSVRNVADEILVADSGSTDGTREFVDHDADCRVVERKFVDAGDFKNWAIPQACHPWVFVLDADERVSIELGVEIRKLIDIGPNYDGYWVDRSNYFLGHALRHTSWGRDKVIRLFHRDRARYFPYTDHSEINLLPHQVSKLRAPLIHHPCRDIEEYFKKMFRYAEQQAALWYRQGRRPNLFRVIFTGPLRFIRSYFIELGILDGMPGFHVSMLTGFYSYLKQARLWQHHYSKRVETVDTWSRPSPALLNQANETKSQSVKPTAA